LQAAKAFRSAEIDAWAQRLAAGRGHALPSPAEKTAPMAYSHSLADRVRQALRPNRRIAEKKMFGGIAFLSSGNILVGVWQNSLIVRLGPDRAARALEQPHVRPFDATGRPMQGWVMVAPDGLDGDRELSNWIERALEFVATLPAK
jgi:TfoX/Sxy family transcriptional regulator of competence genes